MHINNSYGSNIALNHNLLNKAIVLSNDFRIHREVKSQMSNSNIGLIHITDVDVARQILQKQSIRFLLWDTESQDINSLSKFYNGKENAYKTILLSNNTNYFQQVKEMNGLPLSSVELCNLMDLSNVIETFALDDQSDYPSHVFDSYVEEIRKTDDVNFEKIIRKFVGESELVRKVQETIAQIANANMNVLIRGESGTGKGVVAQLIHSLSDREDTGEFTKINCPSIPEQLFESELFGHEPGAFTGAVGSKPGRLEMANKGTVFLDEIADIPIMIQAKLLEFLETKQYTRIGGSKTKTLDARILSATNAPLENMMQKQQFRTDLFYRLNEFVINIPPLRSRIGDVPLLINQFRDEFAAEFNIESKPLSHQTIQYMFEYHWPGNVRELRSLIKSYVFSGDESLIQNAVKDPHQTIEQEKPSDRMEKIEAETILATLNETRWNQKQAAKLLGISYSSIRRKIKKYQLTG